MHGAGVGVGTAVGQGEGVGHGDCEGDGEGQGEQDGSAPGIIPEKRKFNSFLGCSAATLKTKKQRRQKRESFILAQGWSGWYVFLFA